jgi:hypothetical protein
MSEFDGLVSRDGVLIAVHGDRFVVVETDKVGSFDELRQLLRAGSAP